MHRFALIALLFIPLSGAFFLATLRLGVLYAEVEELKNFRGTFKELSARFKDIATERGAPYAYEVLRRATLPPDTDFHLLGHVVGDELYKQQGLKGIAECTQEFRNACSHSIVINALLERGESALADIALVCARSPGGRGAYTMCYHGLGHGVFSYTLYDLPQTVSLCMQLGTPEYRGREGIECVGGAIMELIGGGGHDPKLWAEKRVAYFKDDDPLYPCNAAFMPAIARETCYVYLTPRLFEEAGAELAHPDPSTFAKATSYCDAIPITETTNRYACFGGFGKEYVGLVQGRDIRSVDRMSNERMRTAQEWCLLTATADGIISCMDQALQSIFWGGENDPAASIRFCSLLADADLAERCYQSLAKNISFYLSGDARQRSACAAMPEEYRLSCLAPA